MLSADDAIPAQNGHSNSHYESVSAKYEEEKSKRIRAEGPDQYVELKTLSKHKTRVRSLDDDIFVDHDALNAQAPNLADGDEIKLMVLGAGIAGTLGALHVITNGIFKAEDIRIVDRAGGFGGTWYYNRYPGVTTDAFCCTYLPMLDETEYVPKNRQSTGEEMREQFRLLAEKFNLHRSAVFRTDITSMEWDEASRRWVVSVTQSRGPKEKPVNMTVKTQFFIWAGGLFTHPKLPNCPGLEDYQGTIMHTARWNYNLTGGSSAEPVLSKLKDKTVAVIGAGPSGTQVTRELAKWAKHLYVIYRTPPAVHAQRQGPIDLEWFAKQRSSGKGWWRRICDNHNDAYDRLDEPRGDYDNFLMCQSYGHVLGRFHDKEISPDEVPAFIDGVLKQDLAGMDKLRKRIDASVDDAETAQHLKPWHPSWCKRPSFSDDFYSIFNQPNVTLVPVNGEGLERLTRHGVVAGGREYEVDFFISGSGFRTFGRNNADPSLRSDTIITGKGGRTLTEKWASDPGPASLHGVLSNSFPNLFFIRSDQTAACLSTSYCDDLVAEHIAWILQSAHARADDPEMLTIESTAEADEAWTARLVKGSTWFSPLSTCAPNYLNNELKERTPAEAARAARAVSNSQGPHGFKTATKAWREEGSMEGLVISW